MKSRAAIGSHPIHPMLVPIPIGAFVIALIGDILHMGRPEDPFWYDLSFTCIGIGLLFALTAAVFGAIDYISLKMSSRAFRLATWHAVVNLTTSTTSPWVTGFWARTAAGSTARMAVPMRATAALFISLPFSVRHRARVVRAVGP